MQNDGGGSENMGFQKVGNYESMCGYLGFVSPNSNIIVD